MHIAITGNIGSGKTTLAEKLAKHYGWEVLYEAVEGNPYLSDFYGDMDRWSFHLQIYFLKSRFEQVLEIMNSSKKIIQDRTIYEDAYIFAQNLRESGKMTETDFQTYFGLFSLMMNVARAPDLMIYLKASLPKLTKQIKKRGRDFELAIPEEYLESLNTLYANFTENYKQGKVLVIDVDDLDYAANEADFNKVLEQVDHALLFA